MHFNNFVEDLFFFLEGGLGGKGVSILSGGSRFLEIINFTSRLLFDLPFTCTLKDVVSLDIFLNSFPIYLPSFRCSFSCNFMIRKGWSALHGVNKKQQKSKFLLIKLPFHLKSPFHSRDIQIFVFFVFPSSLPVSHCFWAWSKLNPKVCDVINCLNKNLMTHFLISWEGKKIWHWNFVHW